MKNQWRAMLWRHGLYVYARDAFIFFVNLYAWSESRDIRTVALFNIFYLAFHTLGFQLFLPLVKRGHGQAVMRSGVAGLGLCLVGLLMVQESLVQYLSVLGAASGLANGAYWFVNHIDSFDQTSDKSRASFLSHRKVYDGAARLAGPAVGGILFILIDNEVMAYSAIFMTGLTAVVATWILVRIPSHKPQALTPIRTYKHILKTPGVLASMTTTMLYGLVFKSAVAVLLLPVLIFEVVGAESDLSFIQTGIEVFAMMAAYAFALYGKNTGHIGKAIAFAGGISVIGLVGLAVNFSIQTYILYTIAYAVALSAMNIGLGTVANNVISRIKGHEEHRAEYMALRELFFAVGATSGFVFVYLFGNLTIGQIRPLLVVMAIGTALLVHLALSVWKDIKVQ